MPNRTMAVPPSSEDPVSVLVADDHEVVREGIIAILGRQSDMVVVAEARDGAEALALWRDHRPRVSLLDLRMPHLSGVRVIEAIRGIDAEARVVILTTFDTDEDIYQAIASGAKAYLLKDCTREELLTCIRRVATGETHVAPNVAAKLIGRMSKPSLTARESDVLKALVRGESNKRIALTLGISETTVKSHVKRICQKLKATSRAGAVSAALREGWITL